MDIVLFGMQGSGKGTQGKIFAERHGIQVFETGAELRKLASDNSELGKKIKSIIEAGHLVSNEIVMEIIENFMKTVKPGINVLFDGIPRKTDQAKTFDALMKKLNRNFVGVLINISEETAMKRLTTRRICGKCKEVYPAQYKKNDCEKCGGELVTRKDDNSEAIATRIKAFQEETMPVIKKYQADNKMLSVNGDQSIENVDKDLESTLSGILA